MQAIEKGLGLLSAIVVYTLVVHSNSMAFPNSTLVSEDIYPVEQLTAVDPEYVMEDEVIIAQSSDYPSEIEAMLDATPFGSDIYLEEKVTGEVYLRIELTVAAPEKVRELGKEEIIEQIPFEETIVM